MNKFRPQDLSKRYIIKERLRYGQTDSYNWQTRIKWYPVGWGFNKRVLGGIHGRLHYLACHAPVPIQKQWSKAYKLFEKQHFGVYKRASMRYLNKWSCHSWM